MLGRLIFAALCAVPVGLALAWLLATLAPASLAELVGPSVLTTVVGTAAVLLIRYRG